MINDDVYKMTGNAELFFSPVFFNKFELDSVYHIEKLENDKIFQS